MSKLNGDKARHNAQDRHKGKLRARRKLLGQAPTGIALVKAPKTAKKDKEVVAD